MRQNGIQRGWEEAIQLLKQYQKEVVEEDPEKASGVGYAITSAIPKLRFNYYDAFLSDCLKEKLGEKEKHTLGETQEAFKQCVLYYKEHKEEIKKKYSNKPILYLR